MVEGEGEHGGRSLAITHGAEYRAEAAQSEQLERDRRRGVCRVERRDERPLRLSDIAERECGEADPAEGGDHAPPVVDFAERLVAGPAESQRLLVIPHAVRAEARAAQCVAGAADVP